MAELNIQGASAGSALMQLLVAPDIEPGDSPSYQLCKEIYLYHPMGPILADKPGELAQQQRRKITIGNGPEELLVRAYNEEWQRLFADRHIRNVKKLSRVYGISSIVYGVRGKPTDKPISPSELAVAPDLYFNVLDPLNTAGSLVLNQDPNAPDFQRPNAVRSGSNTYHPSRTCIVLNEEPIYIGYTTSAFGFVGRSVYQRALLPLKSFINTMITDDMIARKSGLLIAKMEQPGSATDKFMQRVAGIKRNILREAGTNNVLSIGLKDEIETLNMQNLAEPYRLARDNILKNMASGGTMPALILDEETFARGMAEGTEDAKRVAQYIDGYRLEMQPLYDYFDRICQLRAWNEEFYATVQEQIPEYKGVRHSVAFYQWVNSFRAVWPNYLEEPDSEKVKVSETRQKTLVSVAEVILSKVPQSQAAEVLRWIEDNVNADEVMFTSPLALDYEEIANYEPPASPFDEIKPPKPESSEA